MLLAIAGFVSFIRSLGGTQCWLLGRYNMDVKTGVTILYFVVFRAVFVVSRAASLSVVFLALMAFGRACRGW